MYRYLFMVSLLFACCTKKQEFSSLTENHKSLYVLGGLTAQRVNYLELSKSEKEMFFRGFSEYGLEKNTDLIISKNRNILTKFLDKRMLVFAKKKKEENKDIFTKFKEGGGTFSLSGLGYKIKKSGSNKKPAIKDLVEIHYHGTFPNGEVFDSSIDRKRKLTLPMGSIIRGWQEALQLIGEGGEIEIIVPSALAYGDRGSPPKVPGGQTLLFRILLYKVVAT